MKIENTQYFKNQNNKTGIQTNTDTEPSSIFLNNNTENNIQEPLFTNTTDTQKKDDKSAQIMTDFSSKLQNAIDEKYNEAVKSGVKLTPSEDDLSEDQQRWSVYADKYSNINEASAQKKAKTFYAMLPDSGNGKIDKPAKQISNNCWLVGGLNSLTTSKTGQTLIENNLVKDNNKHIFAIHLQEAENKHLPAPKGDGIYTFTEKEVFDAQKRNSKEGLVSGDGDVAAFALAIEEYLKVSNNGQLAGDKTHFSDGAKVSRLYEIITGEERKTFENENNTGVTFVELDTDTNKDNSDFEFIQKIYENQSGSATLNIKGHAFSVVSSDKDNLFIQESNLTEGFKNSFELVPDTYPPTYKLSKSAFQSNVESYGLLKWQ